MSFDWKKLKRRALRLLKKPRAKWYLLGGGATVAAIFIALIFLLGGDDTPPLITDGDASSITLVFGGDLNVTETTASQSLSTALLDVAPIFAQADAACLNLEGTFGTQSSICAPGSWAQELKAMGLDIIQCANSCSLKGGMLGLAQSLDVLHGAGLATVGAYSSNSDFTSSGGYTLLSVCGVKIAFVAFTKGMDGMALPSGYEQCVNLLYTDYTSTYKKIDTEGITAVLQAAQKAQPDIIIALVHWGSEDNTTVSPTQKKIVKLMQQNGVAAVIGTHSHQVQSVQYDDSTGSLVAYSLGDLYGDAPQRGNQYSILLQLEITKNWDTGAARITAWDYTPVYTLSADRDGEAPRLLQIRQAIAAYESNHIDKVSQAAYENMLAALEQIDSRIQPQEEDA